MSSQIETRMEEPKASLTFEQARELATSGARTLDLLISADKIRQRYHKNNVFTCSILNAKSGLCSEDCAFCAQSAHNHTGVKTYPLLSMEKLVDKAVRMEDDGATHYSMVTSGFVLGQREIETICNAALTIKNRTGLSVCASLGLLTEPVARLLKESGVSTYHHNLETARSYFGRVCTTHDYDEDIQTNRIARAAGLRVCSGGIMGLGESWAQRMELAFTLKEMDADSIPINFLNPIKGTPMAERPLLPPMEALRIIAMFRLVHPEKNITICGGRERTLKDFQSWVFMAGANGLMIGDYLTTEGRNAATDMEMIRDLGLEAYTGAGV